MRKKSLCVVLALVMCMMVALPTFADNDAKITPNRAEISASFGLKLVSGSTYKMWARLNNPTGASVYARLTLYDASYNSIASINTTSTSSTISLNKNLTLSSGTYHLRLSYTVDGSTTSAERTYNI